jgi:hypothetical protein
MLKEYGMDYRSSVLNFHNYNSVRILVLKTQKWLSDTIQVLTYTASPRQFASRERARRPSGLAQSSELLD